MQIAGLQRTTLVDYPGKVAATVFTRGCSFRCPFCHNPELVVPEKFSGILFDEEEFITFLESRVGKLQAVCITGGEPTLQPDLLQFIKKIKKLGFLVKLDSNGWNPKVLEEIIASGEIDYVAMDIKAAPNKYLAAAGIMNYESSIMEAPSRHPELVSGSHNLARHSGLDPESSALVANIKKSISLIMNSQIDYEFRTTVCHPIHKVEDFEQIGKLIKGVKRYYIQNFVESKQISKHQKFKPFTDEEMEKAKEIINDHVEEVKIR